MQNLFRILLNLGRSGENTRLQEKCLQEHKAGLQQPLLHYLSLETLTSCWNVGNICLLKDFTD